MKKNYTEKKHIPLLILVRHGECISHAKDRLFGQLDLPLDPLGEFQLERCGEIISWIISKVLKYQGQFRSFISSDLLRSIESANIIQKVMHSEIGLSAPIYHDPRLREYHLGNWENQKLDHVYDEVLNYIEEFKRNPTEARPPGILAESENMMHQRVKPIIKYFYDFLFHESLSQFSNPKEEEAFEKWLANHSKNGIAFDVHLWVVHEGSARMILNCLNIESWTPNMEEEFLHDIHQTFFQRGDILLLAPHLENHHLKIASEKKYSIFFRYKSSEFAKQRLVA